MKRIIFIPVLYLFFCFLLCGRVNAAETDTFFTDEWTYKINTTGITLTDYRGDASDLLIPSELDGKPVTQLGNDLFYGNMKLKSVVIPGTVTAIGSNAFNSCTSLEDLQLSFTIKTIAAGTFRNCIRLKEVLLPKTVTSIGNFAFAECRSLREIYLPNISSVGESAFENCEQLSAIYYSKRLTNVDAFAFRNTAWLNNQTDEFVFIGRGVLLKWNGSGSEVTLPWGTVQISGTFAENEDLETVFLPDTVRVIGKYAFRNAVNLKDINIPQYVTTIGDSAFEGCSSLRSVEFPVLTSSINAYAFRNCKNLAEISIPARVKTIAAQTFADCPSLRNVILPETVTKIDKTAFNRSDNVILDVIKGSEAETFAETYSIPCRYPVSEKDGLVYYEGPDGIHITGYSGNQAIVEIPDRLDGVPVTMVDAGAFQKQNCVRAVLLPASLKEIAPWAFSYMDRLEYILIPAGLRSLGNNAFTGSMNLHQVRLPRRLQEIGADPFERTSDTELCTMLDSAPARLLTDMGYTVLSPEMCSIPNDKYALSEVLSACFYDSIPQDIEPREILSIPDGLTVLDADLIRNEGDDLVLFIPASIESIDEEILNGRSLTIVSETGTAAESFAQKYGLPFYVK